MPIDPDIISRQKPVAFPSIAGVMTDAAQIQESQARAQAWRQKAMEDAADQSENEQIKQVLQQTGGDFEKALPQIATISPFKAQKIQQTVQQSQEAKAKLEDFKLQHDLHATEYVSRQLQGVTDQQSYDYARAAIAGAGLPVDKMQPTYDPAYVESLRQKGLSMKERIELAREERQAKFQQLTAERQQSAEERAQAREDRMAKTQEAQLGLERQRVGLEGARVSMERQRLGADLATQNAAVQAANPNAPHGEDFIKTLPPAQASQVKALAEGRMQFPSGFALKSPYWQQMLSAVAQYDPNFDTINYNARAKTRSDFTSGKSAQQVNALNTVIGHLDTLAEKAKALNNSSWKSYNSLANFISTETGDPKVTNFKVAREAVVDELTRVWRQAGGSEKDIEARKEQLDAAASPDQLYGAIAGMGDLLESKLGSMQEQYQQGTGTKSIEMITPQARSTLTKLERLSGRQPVQAVASSGPKVGEIRTVNGVKYTWDGKGWLK